MNVTAIAFSGKAGSGKSTIAEATVEALERHGWRACRLSFAQPATNKVKRDTRYDGLSLTEIRKRKIDLMEAGRKRDPDWWIRQVAPAASRLQRLGIVPVFDDLRTVRELHWLEECGAFTVRVDVPAEVRMQRLVERGEDGWFAYSPHPTEMELDGKYGVFDHIIRGELSPGAIRAAGEDVAYRARKRMEEAA